jgi:23S rRNA (adenine2503-C2)-methyltransferase
METAFDPVAVKPIPIRTSRPKATSIYDLTLDELSAWMTDRGFPAYRAKQLFAGLYQQLAESFDEMSVLPRTLREQLAAELPISAMVPVNEVATQNRDTVKTLYETATHDLVETVLMIYRDRATVCVSCQVGCAVGCAFCATGLMGLQRNLTTGQMVAQAVGAARSARDMGRPLTNLVMMGMGEPFHNYPATMKFLNILNDPAGMGMGARRMTISTSGVVPFIEKLADESLQVNLAISLHGPNDELRSSLVPIARKHPLSELLAAVDHYTEKTRRRISFEYALMSGINDSDEVALELARLMRGRLVHLNVIPFNKVDVLDFERPTTAGIDRFAELAGSLGTPVTVRYSRGLDISAACGQLRSKVEAKRRAGEQVSGAAS